ncbi:retrovirus-related pol polyprotein from transposon TNT 1-94 [Tanacetum coccineum]
MPYQYNGSCSKDDPPMLVPVEYSQWHSRFLRYLDTKLIEYLRKFSLPFHIFAEHTQHDNRETNFTFKLKRKLLFLILTGNGMKYTQLLMHVTNKQRRLWTAIERLQQGESLNVQDVKTNLFWEFGKFTSRDGESMESYYSRFYKLMNELTRNNLQVSPMQENDQFPSTNFNRMVKICDSLSSRFGNQRQVTVSGARKQKQSVVQKTGSQCFNCSIWTTMPRNAEAKALKTYAYTQGEVDDNWKHPKQLHGQDSGVSPAESCSTDTPLEQDLPRWEETVTLQMRVRSKLDKDKGVITLLVLATTLKSYQNVENVCLILIMMLVFFSNTLKDVNARTKKPQVVPISASKPKRKANKSVATPHKKTVASDTTIQKSKSYYKKLKEDDPICRIFHPHSNSLAEKFLGTVRFGNDQFAPILGYRDLIQGNVTIKWVYYVEGLNHNLLSVRQLCDADLEVAFRKSTCFVRDLQGNDLLTGSHGSDLYTISLQETTSSTPICFMAKASPTQAWLWHRRLSHLNFDYITLLSKKEVVNGLPKLKYVKDQLCSPMRVASINGKKYILVIVDDYSRYTWTLFLRSKDETPEVLKDFLTMIQRNLQAQVITVRTDRGTEFLNKTLHAYFKEEGIEHQTSTPRTPEQNGVVERRNRTLVEAARTMLSASKLPLSFWAEAVATACYTQNRSIIISTHGKTAYHIINDRKPSIKHLHIFGCICYITRDGENLDKMKEKGDPCVMVGYSTQSKGYRVYNKRTRLIVESIHIKFDEIKEMMSDHNSSDLAPQRQEMSVENVSSGLVPQGQKASDYDNSDPVPPRQNVVPSAEKTDSSQQGLEFLFSPLLEEYYNPTHGQAEENNNDQAPNASSQEAEFVNPFCTRVQEIGESSSRNIDNTDVHSISNHNSMISDGPEIH